MSNKKSPSQIAHKIASSAVLSSTLQLAVDYKPGYISRYRNRQYDRYAAISGAIYKPLSELATRGTMVERGHIDMDEVDMGWIIAQAIEDEKEYHSGEKLTLGRLILLAPIATAMGYKISELKEDKKLDVRELPEIIDIFLENTTPEDTVNLYKTLYRSTDFLNRILDDTSPSMHERVSKILENEITLMDFYNLHKDKYIIFSEVSNCYKLTFDKAFPAFLEAINEGLVISDSIIHTYLTIMSVSTDSNIKEKYDRMTAYELKKRAVNIIEHGGYLTAKGRDLTMEFDKELEKEEGLTARSIDDITIATTFLGIMSGIKID